MSRSTMTPSRTLAAELAATSQAEQGLRAEALQAAWADATPLGEAVRL